MNKIALTHDGNFHTDDVLAGVILKDLGWNIMRVNRSENEKEELIELNKIQEIFPESEFLLFDIGRKYDPSKNLFDHHFIDSPNRPEPNQDIKYSSVGLIWAHFGELYLNNVFRLESCVLNGYEKRLVIQNIDKLLMVIDGLDTGTIPRRRQDLTSIISFIDSWNPSWNDPDPNFDIAYSNAVKWVKIGFNQLVLSEINKVQSKKYIYKSIINRPNKNVLWLDKNMPWMNTLLKTEEANDIEFVVFSDTSGNWVIQTVPIKPGCDDKRKNLPKEWAGLSGAEFESVVGIEDVIFCHPSRFIASSKTKDSISKLLELAIKNGEKYEGGD